MLWEQPWALLRYEMPLTHLHYTRLLLGAILYADGCQFGCRFFPHVECDDIVADDVTDVLSSNIVQG
jgi:hypothetical protein